MYRILLVDDEALIREGVSENIAWNELGYQLSGSCENGKEALAFVAAHPVDVVLTDICMPYMDGIELSRQLSQDYPQIKIILLSGYDEFEYAKSAIRYGVKEYLLKPITAREMSAILLTLKAELDQNQAEKKQLFQMKADARTSTLQDLIMGCREEEESLKKLKQLGLHLDAAACRAAIVMQDAPVRNETMNDKARKDNNLMAFVIYNICQEITADYRLGEVCRGKDQRSFLLLCHHQPAELKRLAGVLCGEIHRQLNRAGLKVNIGLGTGVAGCRAIHQSFTEAEAALEYRYLFGGNRIFDREQLAELTGAGNAEQEQHRLSAESLLGDILGHIKANAQPEIGTDMERLGTYLQDLCCSRQTAGTILQRVVDGVCALGAASGIQAAEDILPLLLAADELTEALRLLGGFCRKAGDMLDGHRNAGGKKYVYQALDYLENNYGNSDLTLQSLCSYLNISPSRFCSIFKAARGYTFMEALTGIRMRKAKELLENTGMMNYEIAGRVGFSDPHYFSIAFKKATGKKPTEYAKEMRK